MSETSVLARYRSLYAYLHSTLMQSVTERLVEGGQVRSVICIVIPCRLVFPWPRDSGLTHPVSSRLAVAPRLLRTHTPHTLPFRLLPGLRRLSALARTVRLLGGLESRVLLPEHSRSCWKFALFEASTQEHRLQLIDAVLDENFHHVSCAAIWIHLLDEIASSLECARAIWPPSATPAAWLIVVAIVQAIVAVGNLAKGAQ